MKQVGVSPKARADQYSSVEQQAKGLAHYEQAQGEALPLAVDRRPLIIISVPYTRNLRYLLSSTLFAQLKRDYQLVLVGPQFARPWLREEFDGQNVRFWAFEHAEEHLPRWLRYVYALSETLRRHGYWFRFRKYGLRHYWDGVTKRTINASGDGTMRPQAHVLNRLIGWMGYPRFAWRILDQLFGRWMYDTAAFEQMIEGRADVFVIHTATWGYQERYLGACVRHFGCRSMLLPYTTDQLTINGYLITDYDAVCAQGPIEARYATDLHLISPEKLLPLGMLWRRNLEALTGRGGQTKLKDQSHSAPPAILYAGLTAASFPRESELAAVGQILAAIREGRLPPVRLTYRPVLRDEADGEELRKRFAGDPLIELQWPQPALIGVDDRVSALVRDDIAEYVAQITSADVFVMSMTTTMMYDALHFGIPCVSNFTDVTSVLGDLNCKSVICQDDESLRAAPSLPVAHNFDDLISYIDAALRSEDRVADVERVKQELFSQWDYEPEDFSKMFFDFIDRPPRP